MKKMHKNLVFSDKNYIFAPQNAPNLLSQVAKNC